MGRHEKSVKWGHGKGRGGNSKAVLESHFPDVAKERAQDSISNCSYFITKTVHHNRSFFLFYFRIKCMWIGGKEDDTVLSFRANVSIHSQSRPVTFPSKLLTFTYS